jgi:diguanylate cyclase (GGDEF)-like protein
MNTRSPADEERRLAALHALALEKVDAAADFSSLVALAAEMLDCPLAMLNLVDRDQTWTQARHGDAPDSVPRALTLCNQTIAFDGMVVDDLAAEPRFADNPFVAGGTVRFYAGRTIHVRDEDGVAQPIGTLCVVDTKPRTLSAPGHRALLHRATLAEALIAARATAIRALAVAALAEQQAATLDRHDRTFRQAERLAMMGSWRLRLDDDDLHWSDGVFRIHGYPAGRMPPLSRAAEIAGALARCVETGEPFDVETGFVTAAGEPRRVRSMGEIERVDGLPVAMVGIFQDVTERHALETALRHSADHDPLTGLANRAAFDRALAVAIDRGHRGDAPLALVLIDLDGFKTINDTFGHLAGDDVLKAVAHRLRQPWLNGCTAARLGGDEFAVIVDHPALAADLESLVARLEEELCGTVTGAGGLSIASAGTVGVVRLSPEMRSVRDLVHAADVALYAAKRRRIGQRHLPDRRAA